MHEDVKQLNYFCSFSA